MQDCLFLGVFFLFYINVVTVQWLIQMYILTFNKKFKLCRQLIWVPQSMNHSTPYHWD